MRVLVCAILLGLTPTATNAQAPATLDQVFQREKAELRLVGSETDEPSCGGTDLEVYLRGPDVVCLDWNVEMSNKYVERQFFLRGGLPVLAIETKRAKLDADAQQLREPKFISRERYDLAMATPGEHEHELIEHARELLKFYREQWHRFGPRG